jgi:hypothetical protein
MGVLTEFHFSNQGDILYHNGGDRILPRNHGVYALYAKGGPGRKNTTSFCALAKSYDGVFVFFLF